MPKLHDYLRPNLDLIIVGINPGTRSWAAGRHYAGPGNHFWPLIFESGLVSEPLTFADDNRVLEWGIGLTNMVARATPGVTDLSLDELRAGAVTLERKMLRFRPNVVCFNGKALYDVFAARAVPGPGRPRTRSSGFGEQAQRIGVARVYVMPSTSARTAAYQRADKLRFFLELRELVRRTRGAAAAAS